MVDNPIVQIRYRLQTLPSDHGGVMNRNRYHIQHRVPRDYILGETMRQQGLLERSRLDGPDPRAPNLMSSPHLILEEQVVELFPPMLGGLGPGLHLEVLQVRLMMIVTG